MQTKSCTKCKNTYPATFEYFYNKPTGKLGYDSFCRSCRNLANKEYAARQLAKNPEETRRKYKEKSLKYYYNNIEKMRDITRKSAAKARLDPEKRAKINMRKRADGAGLSIEEFNILFDSQGNKCAICGATEPGGIKTVGWNVDHCHQTSKVRFILCCHCNRGLGAFRDDPEIMRRAADLIEEFKRNSE